MFISPFISHRLAPKGIEPSGKRVEIALVAIVAFQEQKIASEHYLWEPSICFGAIRLDRLR
ncbi:hypothetical protein [Legionella parisiensis]|uniref:hypothetical protein n=1 Tax=Legionella parisiensis TaxID=45071 RepID=UPI0007315DA1|nr:hypothetical protein [Legionella parisiensis]